MIEGGAASVTMKNPIRNDIKKREDMKHKMLYKSRTKPKELTILEILNQRMTLKQEEQRRYSNLKKGFDGEVQFDSLTEKLQCECLILNDLLFTQNHTTFQLDSLIISHGKIHLYDVKNHSGDYYYEAGHIYNNAGRKLNNPLHQMERSEVLLQQLLSSLGHHYLISPSLLFINPSFTMYQAPRDKPIIYPTQVKAHLKQLNHAPSKNTKQDIQLADQLIAHHQTELDFAQTPPFSYQTLQKGIPCFKCHSFFKPTSNKSFFCEVCGHTEDVSSAVIRNVKQFKLLFPHEKIKSLIISDWCAVVKEQRVRNILTQHFKKIGHHRWTYFE